MTERPTEPASVTAVRRYLRGEIDYAALKEAEAAADPLERAAWLATHQTSTAVALFEARRRVAALEAERDRLRAALSQYVDSVEMSVGPYCDAYGLSAWEDTEAQLLRVARAALEDRG